jgi:hypothetical protein
MEANRNTNLTKSIVIVGVFLAIMAKPCLADGGDERPDDKTTRSSLIYPNSQAAPDKPMDRVTNDGLDKIKAFYQKTLGAYDLIRDIEQSNEFRRGFEVVYRARFTGQSGGEPSEFATLTVTMPDSNGFKKKLLGSEYIVPEPFTALQRLIGKYGHTQADYDKIFNQYQWLRYVQYWDPGSDGPMIPNKYHEKVFGAAPKTAPKEKKGDQATKADLKKKQKEMQALKESGDIAAMMALAQQMQEQAASTGAGEAANEIMGKQLEGMQKDSWNEWVACLKEMATAARWVRLEYNASGSWWLGGDFWKQP